MRAHHDQVQRLNDWWIGGFSTADFNGSISEDCDLSIYAIVPPMFLVLAFKGLQLQLAYKHIVNI